MALDQSALLELLGELQSTDVSDRIRLATQKLYQELIDAEATAFIGAAPYERTEGRVAVRNGSRPRTLTTKAGDLDLRIPKLRQGSFFPALLERRRRVDQALFAVVMEAYVHGVSTRKVDDLVKALGADSGISKSEVSRICQDLDEDVAAFRERPLGETAYPYVFVDATYCKARVGRQVVSQAIVVAIGVAADGTRQVLGFDVGDTESEPFWTAFFRSLKARGLGGVRLVISDAHSGLISAIQVAFQGASWQRSLVNMVVAGSSRWFILTVGRGPWQRDLRGPAADLSLPAVADSDWLVGVVPRQREHLSERPEGSVTRRTRLRRRSAHARPQLANMAGVRRHRLGR